VTELLQDAKEHVYLPKADNESVALPNILDRDNIGSSAHFVK